MVSLALLCDNEGKKAANKVTVLRGWSRKSPAWVSEDVRLQTANAGVTYLWFFGFLG